MKNQINKIILLGLLMTILFAQILQSQPQIKNYKVNYKTIEKFLKENNDTTNTLARFCSIDTSNYIQYSYELAPINGKFVVEYCHKLDRVFKKQHNKIIKADVYLTVVNDYNYRYYIISEETKKRKNDVKIKQGDTLNLDLSNIFGYKLFYCTNTPNYHVVFDFIFQNIYFENYLITSYYVSDDICGCYIDKAKVNSYIMRTIITKKNGDIFYCNFDVDKRSVFKNWEKLNKNGSITILNTSHSYSKSEFNEKKDTLFSKFKVEYIWKTIVYKKGLFFMTPSIYYLYILSINDVNFAVFSPTKIRNKTTMAKIHVGDDVELKIINIFPLKGNYQLANNYPQYISFISHNLYFKKIIKNPFYLIGE